MTEKTYTYEPKGKIFTVHTVAGDITVNLMGSYHGAINDNTLKIIADGVRLTTAVFCQTFNFAPTIFIGHTTFSRRPTLEVTSVVKPHLFDDPGHYAFETFVFVGPYEWIKSKEHMEEIPSKLSFDENTIICTERGYFGTNYRSTITPHYDIEVPLPPIRVHAETAYGEKFAIEKETMEEALTLLSRIQRERMLILEL